MTLPLFDKATTDLPAKLVNALRLGVWVHREDLARRPDPRDDVSIARNTIGV